MDLVCRICLAESVEFTAVFSCVELGDSSMSYSDMISSVAKVKICFNDGLPESVCLSCAKSIVKAYQLKIQCEESDKFLREKLKNETEKSVIVDHMPVKLITEEDSLTVIRSRHEKTCIKLEKDDEHRNIKTSVCDNSDSIVTTSCSKDVKVIETSVGIYQESPEIALLHNKHFENDNVLESSTLYCVLCSFEASDSLVFENHLSKHLTEIKSDQGSYFLCKLCNKEIKNTDDFQKHIELKHFQIERDKSFFMNKFLQCTITESGPDLTLTYPQSVDFKSASSKFYNNQNLQCNHCNKLFKNKNCLRIHLNKIKPSVMTNSDFIDNDCVNEKKHICTLCSKSFKQMSNLKDHMRTHSGEKPFLCSTCGKGFNQLGNLRQHQIRHSGIKSHICTICGQGFVSKGELQAHYRKHTGSKPFICDACGTGFTTSSSLVKHKRIHSGEKPYKCEFCQMKFSRSGILIRHRRIHTGEKPYTCDICKKAFTQSNDLNSHKRIHTGEKPYKCEQCGQLFRQSSSLKTHQRIHLDSKPHHLQPVKKYKNLFVEDEENMLMLKLQNLSNHCTDRA